MRKHILLFLIGALCISFSAYSQNTTNSQRVQQLPPGHQLRSAFDALPLQAKVKAENWLNELSIPDEDFNSLRLDNSGGVFYADSFLANTDGKSTQSEPIVNQAIPSAIEIFTLHSKPGAPYTVHLDFDGMYISGRIWNDANGGTFDARPYDKDGNESSFNEAERAQMASIWQRVSDDFAAFNIDVTTEEPASYGPTVGHVLITKNTDKNNRSMPASGGGGVAYVNIFGSGSTVYYSPALVYYNNSGNEHGNANTASHEFGHNLGLSHHGGGGDGEYYRGHGTGYTSWAPLMGSYYTKHVTQWDHGSYDGANNTGQDDVNKIVSKLTYSPDDHGNNTSSATDLIIETDGSVNVIHEEIDPFDNSSVNKGIIESSSDLDFFTFSTTGGQVTLTLTPSYLAYNDDSYRSSNLDIRAKLYNGSGSLIDTYSNANDIKADISVSLGSGTYYLSIEGEGSSNYSDYGSLGKYYISGTIVGGNGINSDPIASFTSGVSDRTVSFTDTSADSDGTIASWFWDFGDGNTSTQQHPVHIYATDDTFSVSLTVTDDLGATDNSSQDVTTCLDSDGDGVCDDQDVCPGSDDTADADSDGLPDACDTCPNDANNDADGDGVCDDLDICLGGDDSIDTDGDGVPDFCDVCPSGDDTIDTDGDGTPDSCDACPNSATGDSDGDGVCDDLDICPGSDDTIDSDSDGTPDGCDACPNSATGDSDGDGVCDDLDICPGGDDTIDSDGDGIPNFCDNSVCEADSVNFITSPLTHSGSGSSNTSATVPVDGQDISFTVSELNQRTGGKPANRFIEEVTITYIDGQGNNQSYGVFNAGSSSSVSASISGVVQSVTVSLADAYDGNTSTNMSVSLSLVDFCVETLTCTDTDGDGICDETDNEINSPCPSNVDANGVSIDTDGDGVCDELDICPGSDDTADTDGDTVPDGCDICEGSDDNLDTDGDGIPNGCDPCNDLLDSDGDGVSDCTDQEPNSTCPNTVDANGVSVDSDGDGVCDEIDNCPTIANNEQTDSDGNGVGDACDNPVTCDPYSISGETLTHSGTSSSSITFSINGQDVSFTISGIDQRTSGKPTLRYIEEVTVSFIDDQGTNQVYGVFSGISSVDVSIPEYIQTVTVSLTDGYDGDYGNTMSVDISTIDYCSETAPAFAASVATSLGTTDNALLQEAHVYPIPASQVLNISLNGYDYTSATISLYDFSGRLVKKQVLKFNQSQLRLNDMASGFYLLMINDDQGNTLTSKRIIIKQ